MPPLPCDRCPDATGMDACGPGPGHCLACSAMPRLVTLACGTVTGHTHVQLPRPGHREWDPVGEWMRGADLAIGEVEPVEETT